MGRWDSKSFVPGITWRSVKDKTLTGDHWLRGYNLITQTDSKKKGQGTVKLNNKGTKVEVANSLYFVICRLEKRPEKKAKEDTTKKKADFFKKKEGKK